MDLSTFATHERWFYGIVRARSQEHNPILINSGLRNMRLNMEMFNKSFLRVIPMTLR